MDDNEKLAFDLEARKNRDEMERIATRNKALADLDNEYHETVERLQNDGLGLGADIQNKKQRIEAEYQAQIKVDQERHAKLDQQLAEGKLYYVWIDPKQEEQYNQAKKTWDYAVNDAMERTGKPPAQDMCDHYKKEFGMVIYQQLIKATNRELKVKKETEELKLAEQTKRREVFVEEEKQRLANEDIKKMQQEMALRFKRSRFYYDDNKDLTQEQGQKI